MSPGDHQNPEQVFRSESRRLFGLAYRMLGSVADAEEVVQDAFVRFEAVEPAEVRQPRALLTTIVTRLSIDRLKSARAARERYVGAWLPEPLLVDDGDLAGDVEQNDSISMAFLVLLESLSPLERAVFLLREAFDYGYDEIADIVDRSPGHCRQIALRARRAIDARRPRFEVSRAKRGEIVARFFDAAQQGDSQALLELLAADAVMYGDGGGNAPALGAPLHGRDAVAKAVLGLVRAGMALGALAEPIWVNGQPGMRFVDSTGALINVVAVDVLDGEVQALRSVVNPEKLDHLGRVADVRSLLAGRRRSKPL